MTLADNHQHYFSLHKVFLKLALKLNFLKGRILKNHLWKEKKFQTMVFEKFLLHIIFI